MAALLQGEDVLGGASYQAALDLNSPVAVQGALPRNLRRLRLKPHPAYLVYAFWQNPQWSGTSCRLAALDRLRQAFCDYVDR